MCPEIKVTIITVCINSAATISDTLASVAGQTYRNIEHIIIDGNSSDNTIEIVEKNIIKKNIVVSENDKGIYYAMNKGLKLATGDLITFLNSDNVYENSEIVSTVVKTALAFQSDALYGDAIITSSTDLTKTKRIWKAGNFKPFKLYLGWMPPHQTMFIRKNLIDQIQGFDTTFHIAADYDFILRLLQLRDTRLTYIPLTLVRARAGGVSNKNLQLIYKSNLEVVKSWGKNREWKPYYLIILKPVSKIFQFFKAMIY